MTTKPNYGIDAAAVIRWLFLFSIFSLICAFVGYRMAAPIQLFYAKALFVYFLLTSLSFFIPALWMIYGTLKGKERILTDLISSLQLRGDESILDVGCGRGMLLMKLAQKLVQGKAMGIDLWAVENSEQAAFRNAELEGVNDRVEIQTADMRRIPFENESFDVVVSSLAIHHLREEEERYQTIKEIARVLKRGGKVALLDFRNTDQYAALLRANGIRDMKVSPLSFHYFPPVRIVQGKKES